MVELKTPRRRSLDCLLHPFLRHGTLTLFMATPVQDLFFYRKGAGT